MSDITYNGSQEHIRFDFYGKKVGEKKFFNDEVVEYVNGPADICYQRYTSDYSNYADRKYRVVSTGRRYKTLEAAVAAVVRNRSVKEAA
jgi:hypothetical protein